MYYCVKIKIKYYTFVTTTVGFFYYFLTKNINFSILCSVFRKRQLLSANFTNPNIFLRSTYIIMKYRSHCITIFINTNPREAHNYVN